MQQPSTESGTFTFGEYLSETSLGEDERRRGNLREATARFTHLLTRIPAFPYGIDLYPRLYAHAVTLTRLALCLRDDRQLMVAERHLRQALDVIETLLRQELENTLYLRQRGIILTHLANVLTDQVHYSQAREVYAEALTITKQLRDQGVVATSEAQIGKLDFLQGDYAKARAHYTRALHTFQELDEPGMKAIVLHQLGLVAEAQQQWSEAERCYRTSLALKEQLGDARGAAQTCHQLATVAQLTERPFEAESWYRRTLELDEQAQPSSLRAICLQNFADFLATENQAKHVSPTCLIEAKRYAEQSLAIEETQEAPAMWKTLNLLARIADLEGQAEVARHYRRRERETYAAFASNRDEIDRRAGPIISAMGGISKGHT